jgi:hypothetical protein
MLWRPTHPCSTTSCFRVFSRTHLIDLSTELNKFCPATEAIENVGHPVQSLAADRVSL